MENRAAEILPEALNASVTNQAPVIPTIGDLPKDASGQNVHGKATDNKIYRVVYVFGNVAGTTETEDGKQNVAPTFNRNDATKTFPITDPDSDIQTISYEFQLILQAIPWMIQTQLLLMAPHLVQYLT